MNRDNLSYKLRLLASPFEPGEADAWEYVADLEADDFKSKLAEHLHAYLYDMDEYTEPFAMVFKVDLLTDKQVLDDY